MKALAGAAVSLFVASLALAATVAIPVQGPGLFWIGASGNFSDSTHWSLKSGGVSCACTPSANTTLVTFDGNSGTGTATIDTAFAAKAVTINSANITVLDNAGMTVSGTVTLSAGTLNTNGKTESWGLFASAGTGVRTLNIASSTINLTAPNNTIWSISGVTNLTTTLTGSTINLVGNSPGFAGQSSITYPNVVFGSPATGGSGNANIFSGSFGNLTYTAFRNSWLFDDALSIPPAGITVTGTFAVSGSAQNNRVIIFNQSATAQITAAAVSLSNVEFRNITGAGAATWAGTNLGDNGGNTNITFPAPVTYYWVGNTGFWSDGWHWSLTSGGPPSGNVPLSQDLARFDANSFTIPGQYVKMNYSEYSSMDWTGVLNTPAMFLAEGGNFMGDMILSPNMTTTTSQPGAAAFNRITYYNASRNSTWTFNGVPFLAGIAVFSNTGSLTLGSDMNLPIPNFSESGLVMFQGTFNTANHNVSMNGAVVSSGTQARTMNLGSSTFTISLGSGTVWTPGSSAGLTLNAGTSTIKIQGTPTGARTFVGSGLAYNKVEWGSEGVTSTLSITGANTFNNLTVDADTAARTLTLPASTTQTTTSLNLNGSSGNLLSVNSSSNGTAATLSQASGTVAATFLSLQDSTATGGATFNASQSVSISNVTGWTVSP